MLQQADQAERRVRGERGDDDGKEEPRDPRRQSGALAGRGTDLGASGLRVREGGLLATVGGRRLLARSGGVHAGAYRPPCLRQQRRRYHVGMPDEARGKTGRPTETRNKPEGRKDHLGRPQPWDAETPWSRVEFDALPLEENDRLGRGHLNAGRYFPAHEAWETAWKQARDTPDAEFYKACRSSAPATCT